MSNVVHPGGSLIIAWQLKNKRVLVVGGGNVAASRIAAALSADAFVTVVAPRDGLDASTSTILKGWQDRTAYHDRVFRDADLDDDVSLVLTCVDDVHASRRIVALCRERRIPVNAADIPQLCDFFFGSMIRQGPLQVMISTNGNGPKLANIVRRRIEASLPSNAGKAIEHVGALRAKLRQRAPQTGGPLSAARMSWMSQLCEQWSLDELTALDDSMMDQLLDNGWDAKPRSVPRFADVGGCSQEVSLRQLVGQNLRQISQSFGGGFIAGAVACAIAALAVNRRL